MPANRMNRDEFYTAMAPNDDVRLRKILWTLYWRGNAQVRERIEDELRSPEQPKVKPTPDPTWTRWTRRTGTGGSPQTEAAAALAASRPKCAGS
jgi:hypothetical protein